MRESDIRPKKLHQKYLQLCEEDIKNFFTDIPLYHSSCVACGSSNLTPTFEKSSFTYVTCSSCNSLFVSPRPSKVSIDQFYIDSDSSNYWANTFFPSVLEARRDLIFKPRANRVKSLLTELDLHPQTVLEVGAGHGLFLHELSKIYSSSFHAIEPSVALAHKLSELNFTVTNKPLEEVDPFQVSSDLVVCFEVLEHIHSPLDFARVLYSIVNPSGTLILSTLCIDGFDLAFLGSKSNQISPPHHLNFISRQGFQKLFTTAGFLRFLYSLLVN